MRLVTNTLSTKLLCHMPKLNVRFSMLDVLKDQSDLLQWFQLNQRPLPWRKNRDAYRIWISEIMLQQTTVAAVVPYYEKFMSRFPTLKDLSTATQDEVLEYWAGLGYYSRARNLHRAAILLDKKIFPQTAAELLEFPGFGPYTSRAVASLAFNEKVGVLDGNVIRVLSRRYGPELAWWNSKERETLQNISDQLAQSEFNADINQGLMELGATVCTPKKPLCLLCPWKKRCVALKENRIEILPLPKPRQKTEIWHWILQPSFDKGHIYLTPLKEAPFLKNVFFPESQVIKMNKKPKAFDLKHSVTKYDLYITLQKTENKKKKLKAPAQGRWVKIEEIKKHNPSSLMTKILSFSKNNGTIKL